MLTKRYKTKKHKKNNKKREETLLLQLLCLTLADLALHLQQQLNEMGHTDPTIPYHTIPYHTIPYMYGIGLG